MRQVCQARKTAILEKRRGQVWIERKFREIAKNKNEASREKIIRPFFSFFNKHY
jgi:hypothetical protein